MPAHIPLERGGQVRWSSSQTVDGLAHIPQWRGGARVRMVSGGCGRIGVARVMAKVVVVEEE